ncbi:MAG: Stp1/IreP family PP2C-type Ser/Thr phosphatase [Chloroflexi bacterium]|nr:MAG: Stp1/IreP family PP2C-type Ser/Thr phosphatase [Chloroflexota bacterium]
MQEAQLQVTIDNKDLLPQETVCMKLTAAYKTDVGQQRKKNEDSVHQFITDEGDRGLFIVADGMGAHKAGEVASKLAVETIREAIDHLLQPLPNEETRSQKTIALPETSLSKAIENQLAAAINQANKVIVDYGEQNTDAEGLGCTVVAALIHNDQAYIGNVGDSRMYLLRDGILTQITEDHSLVAKLVKSKQIKPDDVYTHPGRFRIYRSVGGTHEPVEIDIYHQTLRSGDTLLLCSDGLWEMVRDRDLLKELRKKISPKTICDRLIDLANANGGADDISAIVIRVNALNAPLLSEKS